MNIEHTPGPWEVWVGHTSVFAGPARENERGYISGTRRPICQMSEDLDADEDQDCVEMAANAALIAAAPTMYEIICQMYDFANDIEDEGSRIPADLMEKARQIFKSVEGAE